MRNMKKLKTESCRQLILIGCLMLLIGVIINQRVPVSPVPQSDYMTPWEEALSVICAVALMICFIYIGAVIGRWYEAHEYEKDGNYYGKDEKQFRP